MTVWLTSRGRLQTGPAELSAARRYATEARGQGVGEKLMRTLIGEAARRGLGLCLSVRTANPARRLYERLGFQEIRGSAVTNRAGGLSIGMVLGGPTAAHAATGAPSSSPSC